MPRNENYNKHKKLEEIKDKRYYTSLLRDFNRYQAEKFFKMVEIDAEILDKKYDKDYLIRELIIKVASFQRDRNNKEKIAEVSMISALIWDLL